MKDKGRAHPLKWYLYLLIAGSILPLTFFAAILVSRSAQSEREQAQARLERAAQGLAWTMDREFSGSMRTLNALAESEFLDNNRLLSFYNRARRVAHSQPTWQTVILVAPDGRQLINTSRPFGAKLDRVYETESLQKVLSTEQPAIGSLARGKRKILAFPIRVPVKRAGKIRYVLTAVITPEALVDVISAQSAAPYEWTRSIVDDKGILAARTRDPKKFVGKKGTPFYLQKIRERSEGFFRNLSIDGRDVYVAHNRIGNTGWTASVSVPVEVLDAPGHRAILAVVALGASMLTISGFGAFALSRRIARAMASSAAGATALVRGEEPKVDAYGIEEIASLGAALHSTSELLKEHARERDQHLAQAEAARDEAEEASRLKDVFLATVSHELRSPLTAILGWASLLNTNQLDDSMRETSLQTIERCARSLSALVQDLLDTSRIISGKMVIEAETVDLSDAVVSAIESVRPAASEKEIQITVDVPGSFYVSGDTQRLQQVIANLLSNAVKFTPANGHVGVSLKARERDVELRVRDSGIGIKPEFLPFVFDRFRQADGSTTREYGGLGLGLAIARQLVELHSGTIHAESAGVGKGATFIVRLPLIEAIPYASNSVANGNTLLISPDGNDGSREYSLNGVKVLLVDDEQEVRDLVSSALRLRGAQVEECESAITAFEKYVEWNPSIILSDIAMPQQDGYDFIRRVREWEKPLGVMIPAAALTAFATTDDKERSLQAGFHDHISKPVEADALCLMIIRLLRSHVAADEK